MKTQYITDENGRRVSVIISFKDYKKMIKNLEELEDIKSYDKTISSNEESIVAEEAFKEIESKRNDLEN
jgi:hypothetical protein